MALNRKLLFLAENLARVGMWICAGGFFYSIWENWRFAVFFFGFAYGLSLVVRDIASCLNLHNVPQQHKMNRRQYRSFIRGLNKQGLKTQTRKLDGDQ